MEVYADHAATTPMSARAMEAMLPCFSEVYGNPSSAHHMGQKAKRFLESARMEIARGIGCSARELYFTSGGTEADNQAVLTGALLGERQGKKHIVTTAFEHHALLHTLARLEKQGFSVTYLEIHPETHNITANQVENALRPDTCLVTTMYANNEIGSVLPIPQIGRICRQAGVLFHVDAVQAVGQIPVNVHEDQIDLLSLSGHKFHGPRGIGALYAGKNIQLFPLLQGGGQERGKRPGTENLPAICGMAAALRESLECMEENSKKVTALRNRLTEGLLQIPHSIENGDPNHRLPGIASISFEGVEAESLLLLLDAAGICASAGSACSSGSLEPSHVLLAAGRSREAAGGSIRFSLGRDNQEKEIDYILSVVPPVVERLRGMSSHWQELQTGKRKHEF